MTSRRPTQIVHAPASAIFLRETNNLPRKGTQQTAHYLRVCMFSPNYPNKFKPAIIEDEVADFSSMCIGWCLVDSVDSSSAAWCRSELKINGCKRNKQITKREWEKSASSLLSRIRTLDGGMEHNPAASSVQSRANSIFIRV